MLTRKRNAITVSTSVIKICTREKTKYRNANYTDNQAHAPTDTGNGNIPFVLACVSRSVGAQGLPRLQYAQADFHSDKNLAYSLKKSPL